MNEELLNHLYRHEELSAKYHNLPEILSNHKDTYKFFRWLNGKFNGDLFPGKGSTEAEQEKEWQAEEKKVNKKHLKILAEFVSGDLEMESGQRCLWPQYSFDVIPLDFISSIYEEFVRENNTDKGVHYTPGYIVDFILDGVLPWDSEVWDVKIIDPACGSGIFLVKAFQRLIHRWKKSHPGEEIQSHILQSLLEHNLFGVDVNPQAVRVASFSLYLTMCDEIDPRHYWQQVRFPRLRDRQLVCADFFKEDIKGFRTQLDAAKYDLVIGNAPWGKNSLTPLAKFWAKVNQWESPYANIGPLFLSKAATLTKSGGQIAMMQPALALIFNQVNTAIKFRQKLFTEFKIDEIVNLSALRFGLFEDAISPACIITISVMPPNGEPLSYICPKPVGTKEDDYRISIEPHDINIIYPKEAILNPLVWTALMWGGRRDLALVYRLSNQENLAKLESRNIVVTSQGIIRGSRQKRHTAILQRHILKSDQFPDGTLTHFSARDLPINNDEYTHRLTNLSAFDLPQLIIKLSWSKKIGRFQAAITESEQSIKEGIVCSGSYVSVHIKKELFSTLEAACLSYNSKLAVYYLLLSSGRFASYIPEVKPADLLKVPIPEVRTGLLNGIETIDDIDRRIHEEFSFKNSEWVLIEDLFNYTLPDFKGDRSSPGRQKTHRQASEQHEDNNEPELRAYCEYFLRVLKAGFGQDKNVSATIFQEQNTNYLPVRLVAIHLNRPDCKGVQIEMIDSSDLLNLMDRLNKALLERGDTEGGGIFYQRVAKVYASVELNGINIPTVYLVKPDKIRYWTRSMALRDADEVSADIMTSQTQFDRELKFI